MLSAAEFGNYDLIFSNSFIEHLRTPGAQRKLAQAIVASGVPYFIQTPNKLSLVDPHRPFAPWFALYPKGLREALLVLSSFGNGSRCRSLSEARESQDHYNPLGVRDVRALFPDAWLIVERPFGIPMSILALSRLGKRCSVGTLLAESGPNTRK